MQTPTATARLFTVGHSNHPAEQFLALLRQARITTIADVRSSPFSRRLPQYNRPNLEGLLSEHEIAYAFFGDQLGGRPRDPDLYDAEGRVDYERVRATDYFRKGLERLLNGAANQTLALLCSEENPLDCHRGLMIAPALGELNVDALHLRKDGRQETMREMEERLLVETRVGEAERGGLFPLSEEDRRSLVAEAYRVMARRKAFQIQRGPDEG